MKRTSTALHGVALVLAFSPLSPAQAEPAASARQSLQQRVEAKLAEAGAGTRFGLVVAGEDGRELIAIAPDARFIPASNTKMFTTAAAFATIGKSDGLRQPDDAGGTSVHLQRQRGRPPMVVLKGHGDARLSSAPDCVADCLAALADAVAARTRTVGDIVGDDTLFPDQRWSPGMSWNNLHTRYGTAASALTLDDNELAMRVLPTVAGQPPRLELLPYYTVENHALTIATGETDLEFTRRPGSRVVRLTGTILAGAEPQRLALAIDDPAHYAAWRFKFLLEARGVRVRGQPVARHRPFTPADDPAKRNGAARAARAVEGEPLARLVPNPLIEDVTLINKVSQNLHAELMLRRVGLANGTGSIEDGVAAVGAMLEGAGVPRAAYDFSDGSGMSTYNRTGPRGTVTFLQWIARQPWGAAWRATLPVAGVDGTLAKRFAASTLRGRLFAKTGTLNASNALSGYMIARSGRTLLFSAIANDVPESVSATKVIDAALELVAAEN